MQHDIAARLKEHKEMPVEEDSSYSSPNMNHAGTDHEFWGKDGQKKMLKMQAKQQQMIMGPPPQVKKI